MKKIFLFGLFLLFLYSCTPVDSISVDSISLSVPSISAGSEGDHVNIVVNSSSEWTVIESCDWCSFSSQSGQAGEQITLIIEQNESGESRNMLFTFTCGAATTQLSVMQEQMDMLIINKRTYKIEKDGGVIDVEFDSNSEYTVNIENGNDWISLNNTKAFIKQQISLNILPNRTFSKREGIVYLSTSDEEYEIKIIQAEDIPFISLSNNNITLSYEGGTIAVDVNANISFNVQLPDIDWISELSQSNQQYAYNVLPNSGVRKKNAKVAFYNNEFSVSDTLNICVLSSGSIGGHEYIDLGLESGTLWARCNVGASSPEEYGDYFSWGETTPKDGYINSTYKYSGYYDWDIKKYYYDEKDYLDNIIPGDGLRILEPKDDAATVNWGEKWRMPTDEEIKELVKFLSDKKVFYDESELNGVVGILYSDSVNDDFFFMPAGGCKGYNGTEKMGECYYWSSRLGTIDSSYAQGIGGGLGFWPNLKRWAGLLVRPVVNEDASN